MQLDKGCVCVYACVCVRSNQSTSRKPHVSDLSKLIVCTPSLSTWVRGGEVKPPTEFLKKGRGLGRISIFRGAAGKEGVTFFRGLQISQKKLTTIQNIYLFYLVTFKRWDRVKDKKLWGFTENPIFRGRFMQNQYIGGIA